MTVVQKASATGRPSEAHVLTPSQVAKTAALGVILWFCAAMAVRFGTPTGFLAGTAAVVTFVLSAFVGVPTVWLMKRVCGLGSSQVISGATVGTASATLCDGVALMWFRSLYGPSAEAVLPGAACILWGVGWILAAAYWDGHRAASGARAAE